MCQPYIESARECGSALIEQIFFEQNRYYLVTELTTFQNSGAEQNRVGKWQNWPDPTCDDIASL